MPGVRPTTEIKQLAEEALSLAVQGSTQYITYTQRFSRIESLQKQIIDIAEKEDARTGRNDPTTR